METLILLVVAVLVFCLVWWLISILPLPSPAPPFARTVLYILLLVFAIWWLWSRYLH